MQTASLRARATQLRAVARLTLALGLLAAASAARAAAPDPLPSWNDGASRQAIVRFVTEVTQAGGPKFVPPAERIATFDNDGTLWVEMPVYTQLAFAFDRVAALAPQHPEWKQQEPFASVLAGDRAGIAASGMKGVAEIIAATHAGMTTAEFETIVRDWLATARHPRFDRPYTELAYQPMLELLRYLRDNGFKTYIVSGGGVDFMRPWTEAVYGIPPEQVLGSSIETRFEMRNGKPVLMRLPKLFFVDDKDGKPIGIDRVIGRRPILAFGNSDGDLEMLQWTTAGDGPRWGGLVHHTDAEREYAYDRKSAIGHLDRALDLAGPNGWTVVDMKKDWKRVFASEE